MLSPHVEVHLSVLFDFGLQLGDSTLVRYLQFLLDLRPEHVQILRNKLCLQGLQLPCAGLQLNLPLVHQGFGALVGVDSALYSLQELCSRAVVLFAQLDKLPAHDFIVRLELIVLSPESLTSWNGDRFGDRWRRMGCDERVGVQAG